MNPLITMIVPYYRQPGMLRKQHEAWASYSPEVRDAFEFIVVDDGSPQPDDAFTMLRQCGYETCLPNLSLYLIDKDVPWNRSMARNLGTLESKTPWILHVDTDHVLGADEAAKLVKWMRGYEGGMERIRRWYRFRRFRIGRADETRKKDKLDPQAAYGEIHPHIDSYLTTPAAYWAAGGYNEDFSGILGGGTPFLKEMVFAHGEPHLLDVSLDVYTRDAVPDSSEHTLPRNPEAFAQRKREIMAKHGSLKGRGIKAALRLPWHKVF